MFLTDLPLLTPATDRPTRFLLFFFCLQGSGGSCGKLRGSARGSAPGWGSCASPPA